MWLLSVFTAKKLKPSISEQTFLVDLKQEMTPEDATWLLPALLVLWQSHPIILTLSVWCFLLVGWLGGFCVFCVCGFVCLFGGFFVFIFQMHFV